MEGLLLYKLMILYMLDRTDYTMTNSLISGFIVGKDYTSVQSARVLKRADQR